MKPIASRRHGNAEGIKIDAVDFRNALAAIYARKGKPRITVPRRKRSAAALARHIEWDESPALHLSLQRPADRAAVKRKALALADATEWIATVKARKVLGAR